MAQEVIEITEREIEIIEVIERGPVGPTGPQPDINYEVVSSARTLEAADLIAADTSGGSFTLTLPANPSNGDAVDIFDFSETFDTNPLTIARNGQPIESLNEDLVANVEGAYFTLIYTGATRGWQVLPRYGTSGGGGESALTTQGDMLYRGVGINTRLPIGSAGQILKVNSGATAPEWGAAPATGVTSVGVSGSDGIEVDSGSPITGSGTIALGVNAASLRSHINVADGAEVNVQSNWTEADSESDAFILNKPASFAPSAHSSTHHTGGTDAIAPNQISAAWALEIRSNQTITADTTLTAGRNIQQQIDSYAAGNLNLTLPISGVQSGDSFTVVGRAISTGDIVIRKQNHDGSGFGPQFSTLATVTANPEVYTFRAISATSGGWLLIPVDTHTHPATQITGLATVATSGDYDDLTDKPTIPTASSATPQALGVAAAGTSSDFARADHVHAMPSAADVGAAPATGIDPTAITGTAVVDSDARLSDSRTPTAHAASHASAGSDPLFDQDLNTTADAVFLTVTAAGFVADGTLADPPTIDSVAVTSAGFEFTGDAAASTRTNLGLGTASTADIGTGSTEVAAGDHGHGNINSSGQVGTTANLPLKTGTGGIVEAGAFGTGAGEFAEGNHTHSDLHTRSHAITSTSDHTAGNHKVFYSDGSGEIVELALGNSGEVLTSNGASAAPSFAAASGGVSAIGTSAADILSVSGSDLVADDLGSDKLYGWDDSASKAIGFATVGPTFDGTTLRWPVELIIACSDETTDLATGTAKVTFRAPYAFLLTGVRASVNTAPTGSTLIVDINNGANSALSTKLSIDASEKTSTTAATAAVIDTTYDDFSDDAEITIDIDQIGSTVAGKGLKVTLIGTRA